MTYKFQSNAAIMSGSLAQEGDIIIHNQAGAKAARVLDSGDVSGSGDFTLEGDLVIADEYKLKSNGQLSIASMGMDWTNLGRTVANGGIFTTVDINGGSVDNTPIGAATAADGKFTALSASSGLTSTGGHISGSGNLELDGDLTINSSYKLKSNGQLSIASMGLDWTNLGRTVANGGTFTTVDINGGSVDGTTIGAAAQSTIKATSYSGSTSLDVHGVVTFPNLADGAISNGSEIVWKDVGGILKRDNIADVSSLFAGTVTSTGLSSAASVLSLDINSLVSQAPAVVAADEMVMYDASTSTLQKIGMASLLSGSAPLLTEAVMDLADDYIMFLDGGATGLGKKEQWADLVTLMAGNGLTATNGQLSADGASTPNAIADGALCSEGFNYMTGTAQSNTFLPQDPDLGDTVTIKAGNLAGNAQLVVKDPRSKTMDGESKIFLESPYAAVKFVYSVSGSWSIV
jgi:hypothetical protein